MGDFDGISDAVTGGMLARAIEPEAGEGRGLPAPGSNCLNCGTALAGPHCHGCGQKAQVRRSLRGFGADFLAGLFNFEGKFWRTLPMLAWRPGDLTRRYIAGERARFISPIALYLFTVFLMFAVLSFNNDFGGIAKGMEMSAAEDRAALKQLQEERAARVAKGQSSTAIDVKITKATKDLAEFEKLRKGGIVQIDAEDTDDDTPAWIRSVAVNAQKDPKATALKIQDSASKYSWMLIPISVPFVWLLFPFYRRFRLYDHTVFVTYSLSFMMILGVAGGLLVAAGATAVASLLFFIPPIHMYRQLRGTYSLGRVSAVVRTTLLTTFAFIAGALWFAATVAIGLI